MTRVLVLGGGQVGTFAARAIADCGASVVTADLAPAPAYYHRHGVRGGELVAVDVANYAALRALFERSRADVVVLCTRLAADDGTDRAPAAWKREPRVMKTIARAAIDHALTRLVFISSFAVYGRPAIASVPESTPLHPESAYGRAKVAAESICLALKARGVDVRVLRPCGLYGPVRPGACSRSSALVNLLRLYGLSGEPLTIDAAGLVQDEYLYVKDLARAVAAAALRDIASPHCVFNVGAGAGTTIQDLCAALTGVIPTARLTVRSIAGPQQPRAPLDVSRARDTLGFEPRYSLVEGLADYVHLESSVPS